MAAGTFPLLPPVGFLPIGAADQKVFATAAANGLERLDRREEPDVDEVADPVAMSAADGRPGPG